MAFAASGGFGSTLKDIFGNDTAFDWPGSASDFKVALWPNSITVATTTYDGATPAYNVTPFTSATEIVGTGYTAGGKVLSTLTATLSPTTILTFDAADLAWTTATLSAIRGCLIYDDFITTPVADPSFLGITFGADFAVTAGTLTIQWNASGIATLDYA